MVFSIRQLSNISAKKISALILRKKFLQSRQRCRIDKALDFLPPPFHTDETGLTKLFDMM
jgi:hypothetical protein